MSKITIVSRDDQALLIDISGCTSFQEAIEQLGSTFLGAYQFWQEQSVDINLGDLVLNKAQAIQVIALINGVGAQPKQIFALNPETVAVLEELHLSVIKEQSKTVLSVSVVATDHEIVGGLQTDLTNSSNSSDDENCKQDEAFNSLNTSELETSQNLLNETAKHIEKEETKKRIPLYLRQTLRAGQAVTHRGDLIIIGDVNAGAEVMAEGDITIWGSLRGIAHAGIDGDTKAEIRALRLEPIQIRIGNYIARSPDNKTTSIDQGSKFVAEIAKLVNGKIRILHKTF